jgi:hypothetical protein
VRAILFKLKKDVIMTIQHQIDAAISKAIIRAPFTYFDQLILIHDGAVCIIEEDDLSFRWIDACDTILHKIPGELSDDETEDFDPDDEMQDTAFEVRLRDWQYEMGQTNSKTSH